MMKRYTAMAIAFGWLALAAQPASAATDAEELVTKSQFTVEAMAKNQEFGQFVRKFMKNAKGVLIVPNMIKGAFIFGGEGGSGVLLVKGANGAWSQPAFYTLGGISWGLQIGGSSSQIMMLLMTDNGVNALLEDKKLKFGADLGVALGPVGGGAEAAVTLGSADVLVWSLSKGAYIGISLEGSVVEPREGLNKEYYGVEVGTRPIVVGGRHSNATPIPCARRWPTCRPSDRFFRWRVVRQDESSTERPRPSRRPCGALRMRTKILEPHPEEGRRPVSKEEVARSPEWPE